MSLLFTFTFAFPMFILFESRENMLDVGHSSKPFYTTTNFPVISNYPVLKFLAKKIAIVNNKLQ